MKILVTGGNGMAGKCLKEIMPDAIYVTSSDANLRYKEEVNSLLKEHQPEIVIHLAAKVGGIKSNMDNPYSYFEENVLMNTNIIDGCRQYGVKRFIGMLSTCVYPDVASKYPMTEDMLHESEPAKTNFGYGYAKRMMAVQIEACNKQFGTKYSYMIPCNLYSENDASNGDKSHFITALVHKIIEAKKKGHDIITLMGTGKPFRQFMYAADLAKIIKYFIDNDINENVNVCPDENATIDDMAKTALSACNAEKIKIVYDKSLPDGQFRKDASNKKLKIIMPSFEFTSLFQGIKKTYSSLVN